MNNKTKKIKIPCSKIVKEYNIKHLQSIAGMTVSEVYKELSTSDTITIKKGVICQTLIRDLLGKISEFMPTVPMTIKDQLSLKIMRQSWKENLNKLLADIQTTSKPTYLRDLVTEKLHEKGYTGDCQRIHLEWYLAIHQEEVNLNPDAIADAIIEYDGTNWNEVPTLQRDDNYYITIHADQPIPKDKSEILKVVEFIDSFTDATIPFALDSSLQNDIKIIDEVISHRSKTTDTYDYREEYQQYIDNIQTLPETDKIRLVFSPSPSKPDVVKQPTTEEKPHPEPPTVTDADNEKEKGKNTLQEQVEKYKRNHSQLLEYLEHKAETTSYLSGNIKEENNKEYIRKFAYRDDFDDIFTTLTTKAIGSVSATNIMQYIRNVVLHNQKEWGVRPTIIQ